MDSGSNGRVNVGGVGSQAKTPLTAQEVAAHSSRESCWIIVHGKVYDVTDFLDGLFSHSLHANLPQAIRDVYRSPWREQDYPQIRRKRCNERI
ncbi:hypothetical protein F5141DRAFT_763757 [Pisolithus sp. B1]|nr:hypothetical protein F5141DRAFT_763757 [Pisolithus sp. B1]